MDRIWTELRRERGQVEIQGWANQDLRFPHDPNWVDKVPKKGSVERWFGKDAENLRRYYDSLYRWGSKYGAGYRPVVKGRSGHLVFTLMVGQTLSSKRKAKRRADSMLKSAKRIYG